MDPSERSTNLSTRISVLKSQWDRVCELSAENEARLWRKLRLDWNYHSNHIEGNTLTYGETKLLLISGKTTGQHDVREFEEMKAHDVAIQHVRELAADSSRQLTEGDVRDLNKILLKEPFWKEAITPSGSASHKQVIPGEYKTTPNSVRTATGEMFEYSKPEETPREMQELISWFRGQLQSDDVDLIRVLAVFHHRFSVIHPFDDGNGRTMRLLVNYALIRKGWMPIVIRTEDKKEYLASLSSADGGDLLPFTEFLGFQVERSLKLGIKAANGEDLEEIDDWKKEMDLFVRGNLVKEGPAPRLNKALMEEWLNHSILPLTEAVLIKLEPLKKLFSVVAYSVEELSHILPVGTFWQPSNFARITADLHRQLSVLPVEFDFKLELNAFTALNVPSFDLSFELRVLLEPFRYSLVGPGVPARMLPLRYDTPLSPAQVEQLSSSIAKHVFKEVKTKAEQAI